MAKVTFKYRPPPDIAPASQPPRYEPPPAAVPEPGAEASTKKIDRWWYESSYDLRHGLEVYEDGGNTVPGDLLDELFKSTSDYTQRRPRRWP